MNTLAQLTLPAAVPAATANAGAATAATPVTAAASQEFMLMLGELLGTTAPTPAAATTQAMPVAVTTEIEQDLNELLDNAALEAMLPFSLATPMNLPQAAGPLPATTGLVVDGAGISALVASSGSGSDGGGGAADRVLLESLLTGVVETKDAEQGDAAMFANLNGSTAAPVDEATKARATMSSDPGRGLHTPVGSSEWADELGTRMTWMAERGHHTASLRLSPEHLGPLEIRITIQDDQASVWFGAAHADTRAAIEQALPRLRELFVAQGLSLADAGVSHEAPRDRSRPQSAPGMQTGSDGNGEAQGQVVSIAHRRLGLIDAYA